MFPALTEFQLITAFQRVSFILFPAPERRKNFSINVVLYFVNIQGKNKPISALHISLEKLSFLRNMTNLNSLPLLSYASGSKHFQVGHVRSWSITVSSPLWKVEIAVC